MLVCNDIADGTSRMAEKKQGFCKFRRNNDRNDTKREGVAYVYVWILPDKYKTAEY